MDGDLRFLGYPDTRSTFQNEYPGLLKDCVPFVTVAEYLITQEPKTEHENAVLDQCSRAWDIFAAVTMLVATGFPIPAIALTRNLIEVVMGGIFLTDHPELLNDFVDEAKYVLLKIMHANHAN